MTACEGDHAVYTLHRRNILSTLLRVAGVGRGPGDATLQAFAKRTDVARAPGQGDRRE